MSRFQVDTIWCDDVRQEVNGKLSFIGIYQSQLIPSILPITLPKLCVVIKVKSPIERMPESMTIQIRKNEGDWADYDSEEILREVSVPEHELKAAADSIRESIESGYMDDELDRQQVAQFILTFSPLHLENPCLLRVAVNTDSDEARGGALQVIDAPSATESDATESGS